MVSYLAPDSWIPPCLALVSLRYIGLSCPGSSFDFSFQLLISLVSLLCVGVCVGGNVLSYRTTCFGNDQQNLRNLQDSLQMFAVLFALQIPMYRVAQCGAPSVEALACQGPWA